jgi:hypothetical protein
MFVETNTAGLRELALSISVRVVIYKVMMER